MTERHIKEDYITCDWCNVEQTGMRCSDTSDIEKVRIGNFRLEYPQNSHLRWNVSRQLIHTGLDLGDLCKDCRKKLYEHLKTFLTQANSVKKQVIDNLD